MALETVGAEEKHLSQIEQIEKQCFSQPWTPEMLRLQLDPEKNVFLVAVEGETVLGYVGLMFILDEGYISNVAVAPEYRRMGVASSLLAELEKQAKQRQLAFITLEVRESNLGAIALYEKHGYKKVGLRKDYYEKPRENAVLMTLELYKKEISNEEAFI